MHNRRITLATICAVFVGLFAAASAHAVDRAPVPPPTDFWKDKGFILMAHQGGEWDFPPNTMYAYKSAIAAGADMLDMDAYVTADDNIVLTHDLKASDNSDAPDDGSHDMNDLTVAQLKEFDFAHKWRPRGSSDAPPFRGVATGDIQPPPGFQAEDFRIPTFGEVLDEFPDTPINIELKQVSGVDIDHTTEIMAGILAAHPGHDENVIINSFGQDMLDSMHAARPEHKSYGGSLSATTAYLSGTPITPTPVALEPPDYFNLPPWVRTVPILKPLADHDGYKIYVWGSDHDPDQDSDAFYAKLIEEGADSYNTPSPTRLAKYLCENGIAAPDGSPRCADQICPEGMTGIAPDNCDYLPCPVGTVGTPPACEPHGDPATVVNKVTITPAKRKIKAGKKVKLTIKLNATIGLDGAPIVKLRSSNRQIKLPKQIKVGGTTPVLKKTVTVKATKKARGRAKITATVQNKKGTATLSVQKLKRRR
jgi:glycerophosphoryl diester phosphodiesterase